MPLPTDPEGFYAGANIGGAWSNTCNTWEPGSVVRGICRLPTDFTIALPSDNAFIGGLQFGYNFQVNRIVWGLDFDYDGWSHQQSLSIVHLYGTHPAAQRPLQLLTARQSDEFLE